MDRDLFNEFLEKRLNGQDYTALRVELASRGLPEAEIKSLIRQIDSVELTLINYTLHKRRRQISELYKAIVTALFLFPGIFMLFSGGPYLLLF